MESVACSESSQAANSDPDQGDNRDLCAQYRSAVAAERSANYSRAQTIIGAIGLIAVVVTLWLNYAATIAATGANELTREQFALERRPWVAVRNLEIVRLDLSGHVGGTAGKGTLWINGQYDCVNSGDTPALHVMTRAHADATPFHTQHATILDAFKNMGELTERSMSGMVIAPHATFTNTFVLSVDFDLPPQGTHNTIQLAIALVATYREPESSKVLRTGQGFLVSQRQAPGINTLAGLDFWAIRGGDPMDFIYTPLGVSLMT